jgi:hypothetical protein
VPFFFSLLTVFLAREVACEDFFFAFFVALDTVLFARVVARFAFLTPLRAAFLTPLAAVVDFFLAADFTAEAFRLIFLAVFFVAIWVSFQEMNGKNVAM